MNYRKLFLCLLVLLSVKVSGKKTIICGHFYYPSKPDISVQYYATPLDYIEQKKTQADTTVDSMGNFYLAFDIDRPERVNFMNGENWLFINHFVNPGDSLWFGFYNDKIDIEGNGSTGMTSMFEYENKFLAGEALTKMQQSFRELQPVEFARYWTSRLDSELAFFDDQFRLKSTVTFGKDPAGTGLPVGKMESPVPVEYRNAVEKEMMYDAAVQLVQYSFRGKNGNRNIYSDSAYARYLSLINFNDRDALVANSYIFLLREVPYNFWDCKSDKKRYDSVSIAYNWQNRLRLRDSVAKIYFKGEPYDLSLYYILHDEVESLNHEKGTSGFDKAYRYAETNINELGRSFNDKSYLARIKSKLAEAKEERKPAPEFTASTLDGRKVKLSDFRGKVVYIDFWATSCAPCVAELPHILKLQEKFKDNDVVFLYVSFDRNKKLLGDFLEQKKFTGTHLVDGKGFSSEAAKKYHIAAIPRHILVDKKGMLVSDDAPRPSGHPEEMIERALSE